MSHSVRTGLVVVVGVEGGGEKFSDGEILKTTTVGSLQTTTTTLFSYPGHLYDPTWIYSI
jgi:alpha-D-ribose 1-methylphosphonate 5-triphosphate synthase subunit PhnG